MELAMDSVKDRFEFQVVWEPFMLRPDMPMEGLPKPDSYRDPKNPRVKHLRDIGEGIGLDLTNPSPKFPSTLKAHALLEYAKSKNGGVHQNEIAEKLFKKYFTDGDMLQDPTLLQVAEESGFNKEEVRAHVNDQAVLKNVYEKAVQWSMKGINGVPAFYFNGQKVFSGAQEQATFERMFEIIAERFPLSPESKT